MAAYLEVQVAAVGRTAVGGERDPLARDTWSPGCTRTWRVWPMSTSTEPALMRNGFTPYAAPGDPGADGSSTTPRTAEKSGVPHGIATSMPWWNPWRPGQRGSWSYQGEALQP